MRRYLPDSPHRDHQNQSNMSETESPHPGSMMLLSPHIMAAAANAGRPLFCFLDLLLSTCFKFYTNQHFQMLFSSQAPVELPRVIEHLKNPLDQQKTASLTYV